MQRRDDLLPQLLALEKKYNVPELTILPFGIANDSEQSKDVWNDFLGLRIGNAVFLADGTTNPGRNAHTRHPEGPAHMCIGYHHNIWVIDYHCPQNPAFSHLALCQRAKRGCGPIKFWRDVHHNYTYSPDCPLINSYDCCMNWHRASAIKEVLYIGDYSDGCQVKRNIKDHEAMMSMILEHPEVDATKYIDADGKPQWNYFFSYLLTEWKEWSL